MANGIESKYEGVGGWLLFYCLILTVISPIINVVISVGELEQVRPLFRQFPGLQDAAVINGFSVFGITVFSIYAGTELWRIRPNAVALAKTYMGTLIVVNVLMGLVPLLTVANLPPGADTELIKEAAMQGFRAWVFREIWGSYLDKSKRVKATYGAATSSYTKSSDVSSHIGISRVDAPPAL